MLAYAFKTISLSNYQQVQFESFEQLDDFFAEILIIGMNAQIKRGLAKGYLEQQDQIKTIRGKLQIDPTIKAMSFLNKELVCVYDEFSEDILINQVIKTTLVNLLKSNEVNQRRKKQIKRLLMYLTQVATIDLSLVRFQNIQLHRNQQSYKLMLYLAELYYKKQLIQTTESDVFVKDILDEQKLSALYERFVLEYFKKHHSYLNPGSYHIDWISENNSNLIPKMKTDITLKGKNSTLIIDTKYYGNIFTTYFDIGHLNSENLFQIYAYISTYHMRNDIPTSGMVLYAKTSHEIIEDISENINNYQVYFRTLDLNQDFRLIKESLDNIAKLMA